MVLISSLEDLAEAREEALGKKRALAQAYRFHLRIGMASCSIAAGARDTLQAINRMVEGDAIPGINPSQIHVTQIGCIGLCALEPIVQVQIADQPFVTYGKVTPDVARRILQNHIVKGLVVQEYVVDSIIRPGGVIL